MKESDWRSVTTTPTINGVYKREEMDGDIGWQRWCGDFWCTWYEYLQDAIDDKDLQYVSLFQGGRWKGLIDDDL